MTLLFNTNLNRSELELLNPYFSFILTTVFLLRPPVQTSGAIHVIPQITS